MPSYNLTTDDVSIVSVRQGSLIIDYTIVFPMSINANHLASDLVKGITNGGTFDPTAELISITTNVTIINNNN